MPGFPRSPSLRQHELDQVLRIAEPRLRAIDLSASCRSSPWPDGMLGFVTGLRQRQMIFFWRDELAQRKRAGWPRKLSCAALSLSRSEPRLSC